MSTDDVIHFRFSGRTLTACGIVNPGIVTTFASKTTCEACQIAKGWTVTAPLVHYTDHHGGTVCGLMYKLSVGFKTTEVREKVTCPECARIKPAQESTWPAGCPTCGAGWKIKSRTMGRVMGQPHQGTCANGHIWYEGANPRVDLGAADTARRLQEARARRLADLTAAQLLVDYCNCQFPLVVYRNGHGHSEDCPFVVVDKASRKR